MPFDQNTLLFFITIKDVTRKEIIFSTLYFVYSLFLYELNNIYGYYLSLLASSSRERFLFDWFMIAAIICIFICCIHSCASACSCLSSCLSLRCASICCRCASICCRVSSRCNSIRASYLRRSSHRSSRCSSSNPLSLCVRQTIANTIACTESALALDAVARPALALGRTSGLGDTSRRQRINPTSC
jgi:hypothetical protein